MLSTRVAQDELRLIERADPTYWHPAYDALWTQCRLPWRPLGDYVAHLAYGPIVTGEAPPRAPEGPFLVNQGQIGAAAVDLASAQRVPPESRWDHPAARLVTGDLALARSGQGGVARNRLALYTEDAPAVVGSFVDVLRLRGIEPVYVALFLKTSFGWGQIHRLINGVAMPNLSFSEIRGLRIPVADEEWQAAWRDEYLARVLPLHRARDPHAAERHLALVASVEARLRSV